MSRGDAKRQAILDAAYCLFRAQGFEKTSMSEIVARVGGSKATLYAYFGSKEVLFAESLAAATERCFVDLFASLGEEGLKLDAQGVVSALQQFGESYLNFMCSGEVVASRRLIFAEASYQGIGQLLFDKICAFREHIAYFLGRCMDDGVLRRGDVVQVANHLRGLLDAEMPFIDVDENSSNLIGVSLVVRRAIDVFMRAYAEDCFPLLTDSRVQRE
jgi:AcrR family transcriptional regulator